MIFQLLLLMAATLGHLVIWVAIFNQMHATKLEHRRKKLGELTIFLAVILIWIGLAIGLFPMGMVSSRWSDSIEAAWWRPWLMLYAATCWAAAVLIIIRWAVLKVIDRKPGCFAAESTRVIQLRDLLADDPCADLSTRWLAAVPGNQILELAVHEKTFQLEQLPASHHGLTIAHLSDLHFTGQLARPFFETVFEQTQALGADLIAVTGDIIDKEKCFEWIVPLFSSLKAPLGAYYILGNHDTRIRDNVTLRGLLAEAGVIDLGGRWHEVDHQGSRVRLAGNELPWYPGASELEELSDARGRELRILLSHSPDQFRWGQRRGFDLVLAGHTHGGQIRPPIIGPIVSPSRHGSRYASGVFHRNGTLMHVSRGISGVQQIRLNCRPELTMLRLERTT